MLTWWWLTLLVEYGGTQSCVSSQSELSSQPFKLRNCIYDNNRGVHDRPISVAYAYAYAFRYALSHFITICHTVTRHELFQDLQGLISCHSLL